MGCQVALALARRHPARVGRLVLAGPTTGVRLVPRWRYLAGVVVDAVREPAHYHVALLRMFRQMGIRRYLATAPKMLEDDPLGLAHTVRAPCLVVRGDADAIVPDSVARWLAAALPRAAYRRVERAAHAVQFSHPDAFLRVLMPFLAQAERVALRC
jgi:pimeloyl-ACP methyl ester carboxylesterase